MNELQVWDTNVEGVLRRLATREWQMPQFQREFVWSVSDVIALVQSILAARPIGMATIWEQAGESDLLLEPVTLRDAQGEEIQFSTVGTAPNNTFAILDGRQRATAIAMAFGGFRQQDGRFRFSGRYYLDLTKVHAFEQVVYHTKQQIQRLKLTSHAACIARGLVPLAADTFVNDQGLMGQWLKHVEALKDSTFYENGALPDDRELNRRKEVLWKAFDGITKTKLAIYAVPSSYDLAQICEIFETLNTTGTKVSTVDLIHSWLFSETREDPEGAILLRERIDELGELDGAIGWAAADDRPELTVQLSTAIYVALDSKPAPRRVGTRRITERVSSVKAGDLLATPSGHWRNFLMHTDRVAEFWGAFQDLVGGGRFPFRACPYPVSSAVYVALRYKAAFEEIEDRKWSLGDLDALFRAFFWRNALAGRYDQGFLTQLGSDLRELLTLLRSRSNMTASAWATRADEKLTQLIPRTPTVGDLLQHLTSGRPGGALEKALTLRMVAKTKKDLVFPDRDISFHSGESRDLHHIYPKDWCRNNQTGELADILTERADRDWVNSIANLMPLSRRSNKEWKNKAPGQVLVERDVSYADREGLLKLLQIDETAFAVLLARSQLPTVFWTRRAELIAEDLSTQMSVWF